MRTRTKLVISAAAGLLAVGGFAAGAAADDTGAGDVRRARAEMHAEMGGDRGMQMMGEGGMASMQEMQEMHEAIGPAAMDSMHDQMVALLPPELRERAEEMHGMHDSMQDAMGGAADDMAEHWSHHGRGS